MKKEFLMKRVIPLVLALLMVGGTLLTLLPVKSYAADPNARPQGSASINMVPITNYPQVVFYDHEGNAIDIIKELDLASDANSPYYNKDGSDPSALTNILLEDKNLRYTKNTVYYKKDGSAEKSWNFSKVDLIFAYADHDYKLGDNVSPDSLSKMFDGVAYLHYGDIRIEADEVRFMKSRKSRLISEIRFNKVDFFDGEHNKMTLYLQYLENSNPSDQGADTAVSIMHKGNIEYTFTRMMLDRKNEAPSDPEDPPKPPPEDDKDEPVIKSATPYIIVDEYSIGGNQQVRAGDSFTLNLNCMNTHKRIPLENIILKVATSDGLQLTNSSNTFYIKSLGRGSSFDKELRISALPNAEAKSHTITLTFSYEYIADDARQKGEMSQEITIPVIQQDRFSADPVSGVSEATVGEEVDIVAKYINKSRGELFNLTATMECDDSIRCDEKIQHKGNIVPGGSGDLEFTLTGSTAGTYECSILYTYEDALANTKQLRIPFEVTFVEAPVMEWDDPMMDIPAGNEMMLDENGNPIDPNAPVQQGMSKQQIAAISVGAALLILIAAVIIIKKRKAAHEFEDDDENI